MLSDIEFKAVKALASRERLRILELLYEVSREGSGDLSYNELRRRTGMVPGKLSYHLKMLVDAGLVEKRYLGYSRRFYAISDYAMDLITVIKHVTKHYVDEGILPPGESDNLDEEDGGDDHE